MMNQAETSQFIIFDLQLFADEGSPSAEPESQAAEATEPAAPAQDSTPEPSKPIGEMDEEEQIAYIKKNFIEPDEKKSPTQQPGQQEPQQAEQQPEQEKKPEQPEEPTFEITYNGQKQQVKQSELIALAQQGRDYTQKMQALAEQRRQMEAAMSQLQAERARMQPPGVQQQQPQRQDNYQIAVRIAEQELGIQPGEFNFFDPKHAFALQQVIVRANIEANARQTERAYVEQELKGFFADAGQDPMGEEIYNNFAQYVLKRGLIPEQARAAQKAAYALARYNSGQMTREDCATLREHWQYVKSEMTKEKQKGQPQTQPQAPPVQPPRTEAPGTGNAGRTAKAPLDKGKLRSLANDPDAQLAYMKRVGIFG